MPISKLNDNQVLNANMDQILGAVQPQKSGAGGFLRTLGGVGAGVANIFMPGVGTAIQSLIGSRTGAGSLLGPGSQQMLQFQQQMLNEMNEFELKSTLLKNRHDSTMSAIRNMKAS